MSEHDFLVTAEDLRKSNICAKGARRWFQSHGLDYSKAISNGGFPASVLRDMEDPYAKLVLATAERRIAAGKE